MDKKEGFLNKKAMSPLIATVLLIAFAVALGAMIMNWSATLGEGSAGPDCSLISFIINPYLCYSDNTIKISVQSKGQPVDAFSLEVIEEGVKSSIEIQNSKVVTGEVFKRDIKYAKSGPAKVSLIPSIEMNGKLVPCEKPVLELSNIPDC